MSKKEKAEAMDETDEALSREEMMEGSDSSGDDLRAGNYRKGDRRDL